MKVMIAIDNRSSSRSILERALSVIDKERDHVYLICAFEPINPAVYWEHVYVYIEKVNQEHLALLKKLLNDFSVMLKQQDVKHTNFLAMPGLPSETVADLVNREAAKEEVDLLFTGRRGELSQMDTMLTGSTSLRCARTSPCPVYIVKNRNVAKQTPHLQYLVAVDGSDNAKRGFELALSMARPGKDTVTVVTGHKKSKSDEKAKAAQDLVQMFVDKGTTAGFEVKGLVKEGSDARDVLCDSVEETASDVLVVGCRGMGAIKRMLLGSVSQYCVEHASCDVVVAR